MHCIFCKKDSTSSKSVEHIIPESLWNTKQILPPGIVCDKCNNYFSRKVEKPFLCSPQVEALRFHQAVPSKKGRIPAIKGLITGAGSINQVVAHRTLEGQPVMYIDLDKEQFEQMSNSKSGTLYLPAGFEKPPEKEVSRFLAKVALEAIAQRLMESEGGIDYIVNEGQFDPIRNHARIGRPKNWPYYSRRIYDANDQQWPGNNKGQIVHEYDFLHTNQGEVYFVLALYGLEMTINVGGPDIEGYEIWLKENYNASPLYHGKNKIS